MFNVKKDDKALKELQAYAKQKNKELKVVLLEEEYLNDVTKIFYSYMPKMVKFAMNYEKFKVFYQSNREVFVSKIAI